VLVVGNPVTDGAFIHLINISGRTEMMTNAIIYHAMGGMQWQ